MLSADNVSRLGQSNLTDGLKALAAAKRGATVARFFKRMRLSFSGKTTVSWPLGNPDPGNWIAGSQGAKAIARSLYDPTGFVDQVDHLRNCKRGEFHYRHANGNYVVAFGDKEWFELWEIRSGRMRTQAPASLWKTNKVKPSDPFFDKTGVECN